MERDWVLLGRAQAEYPKHRSIDKRLIAWISLLSLWIARISSSSLCFCLKGPNRHKVVRLKTEFHWIQNENFSANIFSMNKSKHFNMKILPYMFGLVFFLFGSWSAIHTVLFIVQRQFPVIFYISFDFFRSFLKAKVTADPPVLVKQTPLIYKSRKPTKPCLATETDLN